MSWWRQALTDDKGEFDVANMMVPLGVIGILSISAYATIVNKQPFDAFQAGSGCAALIAALFASKFGDAKVRQAGPPPAITTATVTTTAPVDPAYHAS